MAIFIIRLYLHRFMTFPNEKKMHLAKHDKSKKGDIDEKVISLLKAINAQDNYYTTSSCSGRVYLWTGTGKKNEMEWITVSHDLIQEDFFEIKPQKGLVWLRVEPFILHVACKNMEAANLLLEKAKHIYKKSCILSASNKIMVEIRGSELMEMPLYNEGKSLYAGELEWLVQLVNKKMEKVWESIARFQKSLTPV